MEKINLWSVQKVEILKELLEVGVFFAKKEFITSEYLYAYDWLKNQMNIKKGLEFGSEIYPTWAWVNKPDLRRTGYLKKGSKGVRIELCVDASLVLLSDFHKWHSVLTKQYLPIDEADDNAFENLLLENGLSDKTFGKLPFDVQAIITKSWERVFDFDDDVDYWGLPEERAIQATIPRILISEVVSMKEFMAR